jgi:hypothetical protein
MGMGVDPRSPANRGWGWEWTPEPRQIGDGDGDGDRGFRALVAVTVTLGNLSSFIEPRFYMRACQSPTTYLILHISPADPSSA